MIPTQPCSNILVLGTSQDGGYPQVGCRKKCCNEAWENPQLKRLVSSLAILSGDDCWLIDMTPDFSYQFRMLETTLNGYPNISGIFISHAHMGHYIGLLDLGLEVMNANQIPVYVMEKMKSFLEENDPFKQLVELNNIVLKQMEKNTTIQLNENIRITPLLVPHRNEFSETVGFSIQSQDKCLLYIPDINSWDTWEVDIIDLIRCNDILLLDGTFYNDAELPGRNVQDIPHPFLQECLKNFSILEEVDRDKVYFTHLNHTNPVINISSPEREEIISQGYHIAEDEMLFTL